MFELNHESIKKTETVIDLLISFLHPSHELYEAMNEVKRKKT